MTDNNEKLEIADILAKYTVVKDAATNLTMAKEIIEKYYLSEPKLVACEAIDFHIKPYFELKRDGITILKDMCKPHWERAEREAKEAEKAAKKAEKEAADEAEKLRKEQEKEAKKQAKEEAKTAAKEEKTSEEEAEKEQADADEKAAKDKRKIYEKRRKELVKRLCKILNNEDGTATVAQIVKARKKLKNAMKREFWVIEGLNPRTGAKGHLSMKKKQVAEYIYKAYNIIRYGGRNWWYDYEKGYYQTDNDDVYLQKEIIDIMKQVGGEFFGEIYQYNGNVTGDANNILKLASFTKVFPDNYNPFNRHVGYINSRNGVLQIDYKNKKVEMIGKKPSFMFSYCIDTIYNPKAKGDKLHAVLVDILGEYQTELIYQLCAIAILDSDPKRDPSKIAYIFMGKRDAGKGVVMKVLETFFGMDIVAYNSIIDITENRFVMPSLEGRLINLADEFPEQLPVVDSHRLKELTGGKTHRIEQKGMPAYNGIITALLVFSGNQFPKINVSKNDTAFWDRWEIINFRKQFPRRADFLKEILTEENMSGFFNHVLDKIFELQTQPIKRNIQTYGIYNQWMSSAYSTFQFMDMMTDQSSEEHEYSKEEFFAYYKKWCEFMNIPKNDRVSNISDFSRDLVAHCDVKIGRSGSYVKGMVDDRESVYRMFRVYDETNATTPPSEPDIFCDAGGNMWTYDEDGNMRRVYVYGH